MSPLGIAGICVFATGAFVGVLVTALPPLRPESWWLWPSVRVGWQLGGALWCGWAIAAALDAHRVPTFLGITVLGLALCWAAALDLARGPIVVNGTIVASSMARGHLVRPTGRSPTVHGALTIEDDQGRRHRFRPFGAQANRMATMLRACEGPRVEVVALRHLGVVMSLRCDGDADEGR